MPKNVQTAAQLHSSHILAKSCSKFSKLVFNSMWTENFQIFKLDFKKADEPVIKLPTPMGLWKKQPNSRKISTSASLTTLKPLIMWITTNYGKFFYLLRNLYAGQEATVRTKHGTKNWFQIGKRVHQGCILSPCLFNLYAEYIMRNIRLDEAQAGIRIAGRNINNLRYTDDTTLMAESEEELKRLLMKMKEESETAGLKFNTQKTKIMSSCPITS